MLRYVHECINFRFNKQTTTKRTICLGYLDRNEKTDWIMKMIRKVVMFYESHNMRVYEESLNNQHVSTLIWCPNNKLCPQKSEASFALGN